MIHIFGDSHRAFFTNTHPGSFAVAQQDKIISYTLGPGTAHNFYENRHQNMMDILKQTKTKAAVLIVAGEIDCRLHIPKIHLETGKRIPDLVEDTVNRFMRSLIELKQDGYQAIAWGPHPTRHLEILDYNPEWYNGDQRMRNQICMAFNGALSHQAAKNKIPFATTFYNIIKEYDLSLIHI